MTVVDVVSLDWRKSSRSSGTQGTDCVEVAPVPAGRIAVRDSKAASGPVLCFAATEWTAFLGRVKANRLDL